jgi:hypothetical protein
MPNRRDAAMAGRYRRCCYEGIPLIGTERFYHSSIFMFIF